MVVYMQRSELRNFYHAAVVNYLLDDEVVIVMGDSNAEAIAKLDCNLRFYNYAGGGNTTAGVIHDIEKLAKRANGKILLHVGINDLLWGESQTNIIENYRQILHALRLKGYQVTVSLTWPLGKSYLGHTDNQAIQDFNQGLIKLAKHHQLAIVDVTSTLKKGIWLDPHYSGDGLHLNRTGLMVISQHYCKTDL